MKTKIYLIALLSVIVACQISYSQCGTHTCNPILSSIGFVPSTCVPQNESRLLVLGWQMSSTGITCEAPAGSWKITISLPLNGVYSSSSVNDIVGPGFDWSYNSNEKTFTGISNAQINRNQGGVIQITVRGVSNTLCIPELTVANVGILSCLIAFSNNTADDSRQANLSVSQALPVDLKSFSAKNGKCGEVHLNWSTASEKNSDYFELERSEDNISFKGIHKINSANLISGSQYNYIDNGLSGGQQYIYRLRQVDLDGNSEYLKTISIETDYCSEGSISLVIHPNPAFDKVFVSIKGIHENEKAKLIVTNTIGEVVLTVPNASTSTVNEIKLNGLAAGVYSVRLQGFEETTSKRFIKVD